MNASKPDLSGALALAVAALVLLIGITWTDSMLQRSELRDLQRRVGELEQQVKQ